MKKRTRVSNIKINIEYGDYLRGFYYKTNIGNPMMAMDIWFKSKPTERQLRRLKKVWHHEMRNFDMTSIYYKKYDIKKGLLLDYRK